MEERSRLINSTIRNISERQRISVDDVTDEMIMLELAEMIVKNCPIPVVVGRSEQLICQCDEPADNAYP